MGSRSLIPPILNISSWLSIQCQRVHLELCEKQKFMCSLIPGCCFRGPLRLWFTSSDLLSWSDDGSALMIFETLFSRLSLFFTLTSSVAVLERT